MRPESCKYLWDASQAVDRITRFVAGKTFQTYQADDLLRSAVERQFEIIGESLAQLRAVDAETAASVPESARIVPPQGEKEHVVGSKRLHRHPHQIREDRYCFIADPMRSASILRSASDSSEPGSTRG